ncbi:MAG: zinc-dependent metalloprotease, partial [Candidatus Eremiobacteraeota bacterium]|nr:zinc-dependent metalloprotease [Candidatus Eremiobacteraeota bacterium]
MNFSHTPYYDPAMPETWPRGAGRHVAECAAVQLNGGFELMKRSVIGLLLSLFLAAGAAPALAQTPPASVPPLAAGGVAAGAIPSYQSFVHDATVQAGLIPIVHKAGKVYFALAKSQLGADFIQTAVPSTGLGGFGPAPGEPYVAPARIIHFDRVDDTVVIRYPNTFARVLPNTPQALGITQNLPSSVITVTPIVAQDANTVVVSASALLGDVADLQAEFDAAIRNPAQTYHLDPSRSFFAQTKAFPKNDVLRVSQTWVTNSPRLIDNVPDARSIEVMMSYNIIAAPNDGYLPRIADQRVGYFSQPLIDFSTDRNFSRNLYYIIRWNFMPEKVGQPSNARNPINYYLSNDIPTEYRGTIKDALLRWNAAFARAGILNAITVSQQPTDPNWDAEDLGHNMVRWITTTSPQYGAEGLIVTDPRSGEELNVGINIDAVEGLAGRTYRYLAAPARGLPDNAALERQFVLENLYGVTLHESGHDFGLQHNFIGTMAYTAKQMQSRAFTQKYGVANSVMEYSPINLWPKGTPNGDYYQTVLGPYDYYAIRYGYGYVPNANTPEAELPALRRLASAWQNPLYRFGSDEDNAFGGGHAIDPRVMTFDLTNHPLQWCRTQMNMTHGLMNAVASRFPQRGQSYDEARAAFTTPLRYYLQCASMPAHTIGGEYLSRSRAGDPGAGPPLTPVSKQTEYAAWQQLSQGLFSDTPWHFNPNVLNRLT